MFESPGSIFLKIGPIGPFGPVGQIGPLIIRWYGVMIALGLLVATAFALRLAKRWKMETEKLLNCILISFVAGVLGARLYFVALNWSYFSDHPGEILATWNGGLSIHGGLILGTIIGALYAKYMRLPILTTVDVVLCCVPLAQAIGRWGNFFNSEAFGRPVAADFPLRVFIPYENRPRPFQSSEYFHPAFLYECIWDLMLFVVLYFFAVERLRKFPGLIALLYLGGYSIGRLLIEPIRVDSLPAFGLPAPILASAAMLAISIVLIFPLTIHHKKNQAKEQSIHSGNFQSTSSEPSQSTSSEPSQSTSSEPSQSTSSQTSQSNSSEPSQSGSSENSEQNP